MCADDAQGDVICMACGAVLDTLIDMGREWRAFADRVGDDPSRVGAAENPLLGGGCVSLRTVCTLTPGLRQRPVDGDRMRP